VDRLEGVTGGGRSGEGEAEESQEKRSCHGPVGSKTPSTGTARDERVAIFRENVTGSGGGMNTRYQKKRRILKRRPPKPENGGMGKGGKGKEIATNNRGW